jgi:hypothetical protein
MFSAYAGNNHAGLLMLLKNIRRKRKNKHYIRKVSGFLVEKHIKTGCFPVFYESKDFILAGFVLHVNVSAWDLDYTEMRRGVLEPGDTFGLEGQVPGEKFKYGYNYYYGYGNNRAGFRGNKAGAGNPERPGSNGKLRISNTQPHKRTHEKPSQHVWQADQACAHDRQGQEGIFP